MQDLDTANVELHRQQLGLGRISGEYGIATSSSSSGELLIADYQNQLAELQRSGAYPQIQRSGASGPFPHYPPPGTPQQQIYPQASGSGFFAQPPQGQYPQLPQGQYSQPPQGQYPQLPQGQYPQLPQGQYPQPTQQQWAPQPPGIMPQQTFDADRSQQQSALVPSNNSIREDQIWEVQDLPPAPPSDSNPFAVALPEPQLQETSSARVADAYTSGGAHAGMHTGAHAGTSSLNELLHLALALVLAVAAVAGAYLSFIVFGAVLYDWMEGFFRLVIAVVVAILLPVFPFFAEGSRQERFHVEQQSFYRLRRMLTGAVLATWGACAIASLAMPATVVHQLRANPNWFLSDPNSGAWAAKNRHISREVASAVADAASFVGVYDPHLAGSVAVPPPAAEEDGARGPTRPSRPAPTRPATIRQQDRRRGGPPPPTRPRPATEGDGAAGSSRDRPTGAGTAREDGYEAW